jgi:hypothetical protein
VKKPKHKIDLDNWSVLLDLASMVWLPAGITFEYSLRRKSYPREGLQPRDLTTKYEPSPAYLEKFGEKRLKQLAGHGKRILIDAFETRFSDWDSL